MKIQVSRAARLVKDVALFLFDYLASLLNERHTSSPRSYQLMRLWYAYSKGASSELLSILPRLVHPPKACDERQLASVVQLIDKHGYHLINPPSSRVQSLSKSLRLELSSYPIQEVVEAFKLGSIYQSIDVALQDKARTGVRLNYKRKHVAGCPSAWEIISELQMIDIASAYLKCNPILTSVDSWYVVPVLDNAQSESLYSAAAQTFHYDMDWIKFLKFFVNLNEVGELNGPFEFISDSHKERAASYYKDIRFNEFLEGPFLIKARGATGAMFIADTSGIHRDGRARSGYRHVFQVEFAISSFGAKFQYDSLYRECCHSIPWDRLPSTMIQRRRTLQLFRGK